MYVYEGINFTQYMWTNNNQTTINNFDIKIPYNHYITYVCTYHTIKNIVTYDINSYDEHFHKFSKYMLKIVKNPID